VLNGLETLVSTFVMLLCVIYVFACIAAEVISQNATLLADDRTHNLVTENFHSLGSIFLTLTQFVLVDGIADIYGPCIRVQPVLIIYFAALIFFLSILLTNLVTAVLVDDAIANSQVDDKLQREQKRQRIQQLIPEIKQAFRIFDSDGSGFVQKEEFLRVDFAAVDGLKEVAQLLKPEVINELYDILDADGSGSITEDELINGMLHLALSETTLEFAQLRQMMKQSRRTMKHIKMAVDQTHEAVLSKLCDTRPASSLYTELQAPSASDGLPVSFWRRQRQQLEKPNGC